MHSYDNFSISCWMIDSALHLLRATTMKQNLGIAWSLRKSRLNDQCFDSASRQFACRILLLFQSHEILRDVREPRLKALMSQIPSLMSAWGHWNSIIDPFRLIRPASPRAIRSSTNWTEEDIKDLFALRRNNVPFTKISDQLGRRGRACQQKYSELKRVLSDWMRDLLNEPGPGLADVVTLADLSSDGSSDGDEETIDSALEALDHAESSGGSPDGDTQVGRPSRGANLAVCRRIRSQRKSALALKALKMRERLAEIRAVDRATGDDIPDPDVPLPSLDSPEGSPMHDEPGEEEEDVGLTPELDLYPDAMMNSVLNDSLRNRERGRNRYRDSTRAFWMVISMYDDRVRAFLRSLIGGPSRSTVQRWLEQDVDVSGLYEIDQVVGIMELWMEKYGIPADTVFSLSCDAAKCDEDITITEDSIKGLVPGTSVRHIRNEDYIANPEKYESLWNEMRSQRKLISHIFTFMMNPLMMKRAFPIHLKLTGSGSATNVQATIDEIVSRAHASGINVRYFGSDSDNAYRKVFKQQYDAYSTQLVTNGFNPTEIVLQSPFYTGDIPHIIKRCRARLVNHGRLFLTCIGALSNDSTMQVIPADILRHAKVPSCIFRVGSIQSMDDYYPSRLYNWNVMRQLFPERQGEDIVQSLPIFLFLFPPTCARECFFNKSLTRAERIEIALHGIVATQIIHHIYQASKTSHPAKLYQQLIYTPDICVDMCNALIALVHMLLNVECEFPISHNGSTSNEHGFAWMRLDAGNVQTAETLKHSLERHARIDYMNSDGSILPQHHSRTFSSALAEEGIPVLELGLWSRLNLFAGWLGYRLMRTGFVDFRGTLGTYYYQRAMWINSPVNAAWNLQACQDLAKMIHQWKTEYSLCKRRALHSGQERLTTRYGRAIKMRYETQA